MRLVATVMGPFPGDDPLHGADGLHLAAENVTICYTVIVPEGRTRTSLRCQNTYGVLPSKVGLVRGGRTALPAVPPGTSAPSAVSRLAGQVRPGAERPTGSGG
jgi:hypothetical protein